VGRAAQALLWEELMHKLEGIVPGITAGLAKST
jgi:hypothetical protein